MVIQTIIKLENEIGNITGQIDISCQRVKSDAKSFWTIIKSIKTFNHIKSIKYNHFII